MIYTQLFFCANSLFSFFFNISGNLFFFPFEHFNVSENNIIIVLAMVTGIMVYLNLGKCLDNLEKNLIIGGPLFCCLISYQGLFFFFIFSSILLR